jgi:dolichyl-phosphate beta-glucosyltransferase
MKGFHLVVLLTAGPGIRDTQVCFICLISSNKQLQLIYMYFLHDYTVHYPPYLYKFQCGFKMFTRAAARKLFTNIRLKRYSFLFYFSVEVPVMLLRTNSSL